jgi:hypothetical protein
MHTPKEEGRESRAKEPQHSKKSDATESQGLDYENTLEKTGKANASGSFQDSSPFGQRLLCLPFVSMSIATLLVGCRLLRRGQKNKV